MKTTQELLQERVAERLEALKLTERAVSIAVTGKPDLIRFIRTRGTVPSADKIITLAAILECSAAWLMGKTNDPTPDDAMMPLIEAMRGTVPSRERPKLVMNIEESYSQLKKDSSLPELSDISIRPSVLNYTKDVPVHAASIGKPFKADVEENFADMLTFVLYNDKPIEHFWRPFGLTSKKKAYSFYMPDGSMEPAFEPGAPILVDPIRTPTTLDYALVYLDDTNDVDGSTVIFGRLIRRASDRVTLHQFHPDAQSEIPMLNIRAIHRVLSIAEIIGI
jgi:hypothetical protein